MLAIDAGAKKIQNRCRTHAAILSIVGALIAGGLAPLEAGANQSEVDFRHQAPLPGSISGTEDVRSRMDKWFRENRDGLKKGMGTLPDGREYVTAVGISAIGAKSSDTGWVESRVNAFIKAKTRAKAECARLRVQRITSEISLTYSEPAASRANALAARMEREGLTAEAAAKIAQAAHSDVEVKSDLSVAKTASSYLEKIINHKAREEIRARQLDPDKPVSDQQVKRIVDEEVFKQVIKVFAASQCAAMQTIASFEEIKANGDGEVGVIVIQTKRSIAAAEAMIRGDFSALSRGEPGPPISNVSSSDLRTLLSTFGTQIVRDEQGEFVLLSFAQAQPRSEHPQSIEGAYRRARLLADGLMRQFMGEMILYDADATSSEDAKTLANKARSYAQESSMSERINAYAASAKIAGIQELHSWETRHPANNLPVVGVVSYWRPSTVEFVQKLQRSDNMGAGGSVDSTAPPPAVVRPYSGLGRSSRDF
jgi:Tfp pilus assembly major pilin PilA